MVRLIEKPLIKCTLEEIAEICTEHLENHENCSNCPINLQIEEYPISPFTCVLLAYDRAQDWKTEWRITQ